MSICAKCDHLWGAYEDYCHCDGPCHNEEPCKALRDAAIQESKASHTGAVKAYLKEGMWMWCDESDPRGTHIVYVEG